MITGKAIQIERKLVVIDDFSTMAGYSEDDVKYDGDALVSFRTLLKVKNIKDLEIGGKKATVVKAIKSLYIEHMYNFHVKWAEE